MSDKRIYERKFVTIYNPNNPNDPIYIYIYPICCYTYHYPDNPGNPDNPDNLEKEQSLRLRLR